MEEYDLGVKPGYYIIFDHENFLAGPDERRLGTEADAADISNTLDGLGFEGHPTVKDAPKEQVFDTLKDVFRRNFDAYGSLFVFILTHGDVGYALGAYDAQYQFSQLLEEAMDCASESLKEIPKVFIFQACNGHSRDYQGMVAANPYNVQYSPQPFLLPAFPHVLLAFSSSPGYVSYRNNFIPYLCRSIVERGRQYDMKTLLTLARRELADVEFSEGGKRGYKQIPLLVSTLTKKLRLPH